MDWQVIKFVGKETIEVDPMVGIWSIELENIKTLTENAPLHHYVQRRQDTDGNARSSYVLDLRDSLFKRLI